MKKPTHPSKLIQANLKELRLSITKAAKYLGVSRRLLSKTITGSIPISWEMAIRLSKAFGGTPDILLKMQYNYNLTQIGNLKRSIKVKRYHVEQVGA